MFLSGSQMGFSILQRISRLQGTTLEDLFHKDINTPLWSAGPIDKEPETIIETHLAFLRAGANVILTSTYVLSFGDGSNATIHEVCKSRYQCAFGTFKNAGYTHESALDLMRKSVSLAIQAKSRYLEERSDISSNDIKIALSLGPFGATVSPAQEFDGYYPPPYGPKGYDQVNINDNWNFFENEDNEFKATEALKDFHFERLKIFTENKEVWDGIDFIAFETVPLRREIKAIRWAMRNIDEELGMKKLWWISTVHSGGNFPEEKSGNRGNVTMEEVVQALLDTKQIKGLGDLPVPTGLGINCTSMEFIPRLFRELSEAVRDVRIVSGGTRNPWLVVYPNGGKLWNPITRTWHDKNYAGGEEVRRTWASQLGEEVQSISKEGFWSGIIVGGCCKTGPSDIAELASRFRVVVGQRQR